MLLWNYPTYVRFWFRHDQWFILYVNQYQIAIHNVFAMIRLFRFAAFWRHNLECAFTHRETVIDCIIRHETASRFASQMYLVRSSDIIRTSPLLQVVMSICHSPRMMLDRILAWVASVCSWNWMEWLIGRDSIVQTIVIPLLGRPMHTYVCSVEPGGSIVIDPIGRYSASMIARHAPSPNLPDSVAPSSRIRSFVPNLTLTPAWVEAGWSFNDFNKPVVVKLFNFLSDGKIESNASRNDYDKPSMCRFLVRPFNAILPINDWSLVWRKCRSSYHSTIDTHLMIYINWTRASAEEIPYLW